MAFYNYDKEQTGGVFQKKVQSDEWQSALIVWEKYKRKFSLNIEDLYIITDYVDSFSRIRIGQGKKANKDFLTQKASEFVKVNFKKNQE